MATKEFEVYGSFGKVIADARTGMAIAYKVDKDVAFSNDYRRIKRFDVLGWELYYETKIAGLTLDILDIGYWKVNEAGKEVFEEHCQSWRDERDERLAEEASYCDGLEPFKES